MKRNSLLGRSPRDFVFGESDGSALEKAVEASGDDVGFGARAMTNAVSSALSRVTAPASYSPPVPTFSAPLSMSNLRQIESATPAIMTQAQVPQAQQPPQPFLIKQPRRRRHHHHDDEQSQYGQYGRPAYPPPQALVNTTWPPPAPVNLLPGAPWPPPGAAPGSDLSSFYPVGTPQASSAYWGGAQVQVQTPQPPQMQSPMDVYVDNPSYSTLGIEVDALGRTNIVDIVGQRKTRRNPNPPQAHKAWQRVSGIGTDAMGAADHKFDVIALRAKLRRIGMDVPKNGSVDQPLTNAVNQIFKGWDDAPKGLRAGDMTPNGLKTHIKLVNKLVDQAVGSAQHLEHAENDDDSGWFPRAITPIAPQGQQGQQGYGRRRRHHHRDEGYGQANAPYGAQQPYGAPSYAMPYGAPAMNTTWPPPAPSNLQPGAPWPPPGAVPGSNLSSYYPPGSPQNNPAYWGATAAYQAPAALPYGYTPAPLADGSMPMMPGTNMPYPAPTIDVTVGCDVGLSFDSMGRATIVDVPRKRRC